VQHGVSESETDFLQKPFTIEALLLKTREVLDREHSDEEVIASGS
jgi:DNA-binding response OmpR family regulator